jgi:hypothetical protein
MSNQILISSGAKLRDLDDVIIGTDGVLTSLGFNVANGVPKLDENGKILVSQLPNSVMEFKGVWNAATNTPTLANGTGNAGDVYLCNVAGTVNFGAGPITFAVGDYAVYTGTVWARSSGATGTVTSVGLSRDGDALSVTGSPITTSGTINIGFAGTNLQYINGAGNLVTFPDLTVYVPTSRTLTINDVTYDLSANRTWTIDSMIYPEEGIAVSTGTAWGDSIVDNSSNWNTAYNNSIVSAEVTGTTTKTLTLDQQDGGTITASWTDYDTAPVTSVFGRTGAVVAVSGDYTTAQVTESGNLYFTDARARLAISLTTLGTSGAATYNNTTGVLNIPNYTTDLTGYVPYTGATTNVNLGVHSLSAYDLIINHTSGSGVAASITKGGAGEALTVVKSSGSGNAASITGGVTLLSELHLTTDLADAYIASATNWNTAYTNRITSATSPLSITSNVISISQANTSTSGYISSTDWNTFNGKQAGSTNLTSLAALTFASTSFVKMTAAGTFALDTNTYALASALGNYLPLAGGTLTGPLTSTLSSGANIILNKGTGPAITFNKTNATAQGWSITTDPNFRIIDDTASTVPFQIVLGTGAATFINTISATQGFFTGTTTITNNDQSSVRLRITNTGGTTASGYALVGGIAGVSQDGFSIYDYTNSLTRLYLNPIGNIGIGTIAPNPAARLQVKTGTNINFAVQTGTFDTTGIKLNVFNDAGDTNIPLEINGSILHLKTGETTRLTISGTGAATFLNGIVNIQGTNQNYIRLSPNAGGAGFSIGRSLSNNNAQDFFIFDGIAETTRLFISSTGSVLLGSTTDPNYRLFVDGTGKGGGIKVTRPAGSPSISGNTDLVIEGGGTGPVYLNAYGVGDIYNNLGGGNTVIGAAVSGGGKLQVNGNVNINGVFQINGVTIGGGGGSGVTGSGTTNYITKWTGGTTLGNSLMFDNGTSVGVGTATPFSTARLQVKTSTDVNIGFQTGTFDATGIKLNAYNDAGSVNIPIELNGSILYFKTSETVKAMITNGGNILIGTTADNGYKLQLNGSASFAYGFLSVYRGSSSPNDILVGNSGSVFYIGGNTQVVGSVSASGGFFDTSDARLKTLVEDNYLLSSIANVKAKLYIKDGRKELGYYAQDLEAILPSAVKEGLDGFLSLSYAQVHTAKIAVIEDEVTILKNRVSELETKLKKYDA